MEVTIRLPVEITQAPLRTIRPRDFADRYSNVHAWLADLEASGYVRRIARGYAVAIPDDRDATWKPGMEAAAAGIAAAIFGLPQVALMGLSAARVHGAIPRALAVAVVAVPAQHKPVRLYEGGEVVFVKRNVVDLEARLVELETGAALVTTVEQTLLDLAKRPALGGHPDEAEDAVRTLLPRADFDRVRRLARAQHIRAPLARLEAPR